MKGQGIVSRLVDWAISKRSSISLKDPSWWLAGWSSNSSGEVVNEQRAMRITTVWLCQLILAESISSLSANVFRQLERGNKKVTKHPVQFILKNGPNSYMTYTDWMRVMIWSASGYGAGYSEIIKNEFREPIGLRFWDCPDQVQIRVDAEGPVYYYKDKAYTPDQLVIFKRFSLDGFTPLSPIRFNSESIGFALKQNRFRGNAYSSKFPGYLTTDNVIKKEQLDDIKKYWSDQISGERVAGTPILYNGLKYTPMSFSPADLQLLDMTESTKEDIYGMFRIPPVFAQNYKRATFTNAEHQDLVFVKYTLLPWLDMIEEEFNKKLFKASESDLYVKINVNTLLRGDYKTRTEGYRTLANIGALSINDIRDLEEMNPIEGGDRYFVPMNMVPLDKVDSLITKLTSTGNSKQTSNDEVREFLRVELEKHGIMLSSDFTVTGEDLVKIFKRNGFDGHHS